MFPPVDASHRCGFSSSGDSAPSLPLRGPGGVVDGGQIRAWCNRIFADWTASSISGCLSITSSCEAAAVLWPAFFPLNYPFTECSLVMMFGSYCSLFPLESVFTWLDSTTLFKIPKVFKYFKSVYIWWNCVWDEQNISVCLLVFSLRLIP